MSPNKGETAVQGCNCRMNRCACVRWWPYRGVGTCASALILVLLTELLTNYFYSLHRANKNIWRLTSLLGRHAWMSRSRSRSRPLIVVSHYAYVNSFHARAALPKMTKTPAPPPPLPSNAQTNTIPGCCEAAYFLPSWKLSLLMKPIAWGV